MLLCLQNFLNHLKVLKFLSFLSLFLYLSLISKFQKSFRRVINSYSNYPYFGIYIYSFLAPVKYIKIQKCVCERYRGLINNLTS